MIGYYCCYKFVVVLTAYVIKVEPEFDAAMISQDSGRLGSARVGAKLTP